MPKSEPYILLIDDDEDDLEILSSSLQAWGVRTASFNSGNKAVFYLQLISDFSEFPALVISDYNMPGMNGREVLLFLRNNKAMKDIPVVIFSTGLSASLKDTLTKAGALRCYTKPWTHNELKTQVELFKNLVFSQVSQKQTE